MSILSKSFASRGERSLARARKAQRRFAISDTAPDCNEIEAMEQFDHAARCFLVADKPHRAFESARKCAESTLRVQRGEVAACALYARAAGIMERFGPAEAAETYERGAEVACEVDRWDLAAILSLRAARVLDDEADAESASTLYSASESRAARYQATARLWEAAVERRQSDARCIAARNLCLLEAGKERALRQQQNTETGSYPAAAELFERVAASCAKENLTSASATRHLFKAALCYLAHGDLDLTLGKLRVFEDAYPPFAAAPEKLFCEHVVECFLDDDDHNDDPVGPAVPFAKTGGTTHSAEEEASSSDESAEGRNAATATDCVERHRLRDVPDLDRFVDRCYDLAAVRDLDAFELKMLARVHATMRARIARHERRLKRKAERDARQARRDQDERDRRARLDRDAKPPSRGH